MLAGRPGGELDVVRRVESRYLWYRTVRRQGRSAGGSRGLPAEDGNYRQKYHTILLHPDVLQHSRAEPQFQRRGGEVSWASIKAWRV
jgi:hypothetical protein